MMSTYRLLSFDVAHRSLGIAYLEITTSKTPRLMWPCEVIKEAPPEEIAELWKQMRTATPLFLGAVDFLNARVKDVSITERTRRLAITLTAFDALTLPKPSHVLIEYQMGQNDLSRLLSSQILYHYTVQGYECHVVPPAWKLRVGFGAISLQQFLQSCSSKYRANKKLSKAVLERWADVFHISLDHIAKKNRDDVGDAFLMAIAWLDTRCRECGEYFLFDII
jgi:hypothetical protein